MAVCEDCRQEMLTASSCTFTHSEIEGHLYRRLWYGSERPDWGAKSGKRCGDCGVEPGGIHHCRCDIERCPKCRGQALLCGCASKVWCFNKDVVERLTGGGSRET